MNSKLFIPNIKKTIEDHYSELTYFRDIQGDHQIKDKEGNVIPDIMAYLSSQLKESFKSDESPKIWIKGEAVEMTVEYVEFSTLRYNTYTMTIYGFLDWIWYGSGAYTIKEGMGVRLAILTIPLKTPGYSKLKAMQPATFHR